MSYSLGSNLLPYDAEKQNVETAFKGAKTRGQKFLSVYNFRADWVTSHHGTTNSFDCATFKGVINFLINNAFFCFGDVVLRQIVGIPMGLPPAPQMANGTLQKEEFAFQERMTKTNYAIAKSLNHTHRYIDDITPLNDNGNFEKYFSQIYPAELELNRENFGFESASVLEMNINVVENKFLISMYDKREAFEFEVFRYPSFLSYVPSNTVYTTFFTQLIRISRVCNFEEAFLIDSKKLANRFIKKGANIKILKTYVKKFFAKYKVPYTNEGVCMTYVFG